MVLPGSPSRSHMPDDNSLLYGRRQEYKWILFVSNGFLFLLAISLHKCHYRCDFKASHQRTQLELSSLHWLPDSINRSVHSLLCNAELYPFLYNLILFFRDNSDAIVLSRQCACHPRHVLCRSLLVFTLSHQE